MAVIQRAKIQKKWHIRKYICLFEFFWLILWELFSDSSENSEQYENSENSEGSEISEGSENSKGLKCH